MAKQILDFYKQYNITIIIWEIHMVIGNTLSNKLTQCYTGHTQLNKFTRHYIGHTIST